MATSTLKNMVTVAISESKARMKNLRKRRETNHRKKTQKLSKPHAPGQHFEYITLPCAVAQMPSL